MKQNEINELDNLLKENYENIFNLYKDQDGAYFYNLLQSIQVDLKKMPNSAFRVYNTKYGDTWPLISYKVYGTPNLWWAILIANEITNPLKRLEPGTEIKAFVEEVVSEIISQINK